MHAITMFSAVAPWDYFISSVWTRPDAGAGDFSASLVVCATGGEMDRSLADRERPAGGDDFWRPRRRTHPV